MIQIDTQKALITDRNQHGLRNLMCFFQNLQIFIYSNLNGKLSIIIFETRVFRHLYMSVEMFNTTLVKVPCIVGNVGLQWSYFRSCKCCKSIHHSWDGTVGMAIGYTVSQTTISHVFHSVCHVSGVLHLLADRADSATCEIVKYNIK